MALAYLLSPDFSDDLAGRRPLPDRVPGLFEDAGEGAVLSPESDVELVARIRGGDETAYKEIVLGQFVPLVRFALTIVSSRADAEDVVQETLARVWTERERWAPTGSVRAYLFATVRNRAMNAIRRSGVEHRHQNAVRQDVSEFVENPAEDERIETLQRLIPELSERQQAALALRYEHGMTHAEVAQALGISLRGAEQLVMRALNALRERLKE